MRTIERMSPLDAAFLQAEDEQPGVSLAIASIAVFEGPSPSHEEFTRVITGRLPLIPDTGRRSGSSRSTWARLCGWTTRTST